MINQSLGKLRVYVYYGVTCFAKLIISKANSSNVILGYQSSSYLIFVELPYKNGTSPGLNNLDSTSTKISSLLFNKFVPYSFS